jgi:hypothetical protein
MTFGGPSTNGHTLVVAVAWGSNTIIAVTDSAGDAYLKATPPMSGVGALNGETIQIFWAPIQDAGSLPLTVRASSTGASYVQFVALEYSGLDENNPVDGYSGGRSSGSAFIDAGSIVVQHDGEVLVGWVYSTGPVDQGTPGFEIRSRINADLAEDHVETRPGTYWGTALNQSASDAWTMQIVGFTPPIGGKMPDGGVGDGGAGDGGAGAGDGGAGDGGAGDGGAGDGGAGDGGAGEVNDVRHYAVGCGCAGTTGYGIILWLALLSAVAVPYVRTRGSAGPHPP